MFGTIINKYEFESYIGRIIHRNFVTIKKDSLIDIFKQQNAFIVKMKEDYEKGVINIKALAPYFRWKFDDKAKNPNKNEIWEMQDVLQQKLDKYYETYPKGYKETTDEPIWGQYAGYGDDKYIVAYLEAINEELPNLLMMA